MTTAPGITQWLPLPYGRFRDFLRDPLEFQLQARERYGDVFRFRIGPLLIFFLYHPDHVRHVLQDQQKNYLRGWQYRLVKRLFGNGLVVSEGDFWLRQRRLAQPAFLRQRLAGYADTMVDATSQMLARWRDIVADGQAVDIGREMSRLALAIAGRTLFSRDTSDEADVVGRTFSIVGHYLERRFNRPFTTPPAWAPTPASFRFQRAVRALNQIVLQIVRQRRRQPQDQHDLLSMLMTARDEETGEAMSDDQVRSEALTFFMAGHETSALALTWTWYLLGSRPAVRERLRAEAAAVLADRPPTITDVANLNFTRMVLEESMRLYPPIWGVARQAVHDDQIDSHRIPARSTIVLSPFVTHRHPAFWENASAFDPERFAPERVAQRPKGAYFPFLFGPHQCIGNEFAMLEMRLIMAFVLREFDLELLAGPDVRPKATLALRPNCPIRMAIKCVDQPNYQFPARQ